MSYVFDITLSWFLVPYGLFLLVFIIFSLVNLYHILRWGGYTFVGFVATFIFLAGAILCLFSTYEHLKIIDWQTPIYSFRGIEMDVNIGL